MATIDFDAFRAEQEHKPLLLVVGGKTYELPASLPAALALDLIRLKDAVGEDGEMAAEQVAILGGSLFGGEDKFISVLRDAMITMDEVPALLQKVLEAYQGGP